MQLELCILTHTLADSCKGPDADAPGRERGAAPGYDGRVRSDETPHGIDEGGVPLTSDGVIAVANRRRGARHDPCTLPGFRKRMASPRHNRSSVTKPSSASSYSKSEDRAPSRARSRPPRALMHQRRNQVVEVAAGRGQGPSDVHFHP